MPLLRRKSNHRSSCIIYSVGNMERLTRSPNEITVLQDFRPLISAREDSSPLRRPLQDIFDSTLDVSDTLHMSLGMDLQLESGRNVPLPVLDDTVLTELHDNGPASALDLNEPTIADDSVIVIPDSPPPSPGAVIDLCSSPEPGDPPSPPPHYESGDSYEKSVSLKCPICLCSLFESDVQPVATKCGHIYCQPCISETLQNHKKCPICRKTLKKREFIPLYFNPCLF